VIIFNLTPLSTELAVNTSFTAEVSFEYVMSLVYTNLTGYLITLRVIAAHAENGLAPTIELIVWDGRRRPRPYGDFSRREDDVTVGAAAGWKTIAVAALTLGSRIAGGEWRMG